MLTIRRRLRIGLLFFLIVFGISSLLLAKVSMVVSAVKTPLDARSVLPIDEDVQVILEKVTSDLEDDEWNIENVDTSREEITDSSSHIVQQLPFCGRNLRKKILKGSKKSSAYNLNQEQGLNGTEFENFGNADDNILNPGTFQKLRNRHVVVATLDGRVSLLDQNGKMLWSVCTGQLFSSTISTLQLSDRGKFIKLIPSLTGGLYKYDGESLQVLPLTADQLLKKSVKLAQDVVITGGKEFRSFGVDIESGIVKYDCGISGCTTPATAEVASKENSSGIVLVIKKTLQTVRAIDSTTGNERWNFSVGMHELALAGITEGCYESTQENSAEGFPESQFRMSIPEGVILSTDGKDRTTWTHKFESPISQAWILEDSRLELLDPIKISSLVNDPPSLYVGIHKQQLYVQESWATRKRVLTIMDSEDGNQSEHTMEPLQIGWKPRTDTPSVMILSASNVDSTALAPLHSKPFFVYERDEVKFKKPQLAIEAPPSVEYGPFAKEMVEEVMNFREDSIDATVIMGLAALWYWWREILGISLLTAFILNIILLRPVVYLTRRRTIAEVVNQVNLFMRRERYEQQLALPGPSNPPLNVSDSLEVSRSIRSSSSSSANSSTQNEDQVVPFISQYLKEFVPIQCLGRGAFGTVFEAKKKIDDRSYAVKRIPLPDRAKSRDRVMREVKALARLDHRNIVRYFNAWIESPPTGWLELNDPLWNSITLHSTTPTYDQFPSSDAFGSKFTNQISKRDYSEVAIGTTPESEGDDSFIVFENESNSHEEVNGILSEADSGIKFTPQHYSIQEESGADWSIESGNEELDTPLIENDDKGAKSKFFFRPTTLDIQSSPDVTSNISITSLNNNAGEENAEGSPGSIMYLYIQQELCQKRTLQDWLRAERQRNLRQVMGMFSQLVEAVEYIHLNKLIHRDLKPGNIFLAGDPGGTGDMDEMTIRIGDFGLATTLAGEDIDRDSGNSGVSRVETDSSKMRNAKLTGLVGTQLYMAPEQFQMKSYDHKVDIFSLGLIFYELLVPFSTDMEKHLEFHRLREMKFPNYFIKSHPEQYDLIRDMVSHDPNSRPDACEIKSYLSKNLLGTSFRSHSYPEHLVLDTSKRRSLNVRGREDKERNRHIYKTHSAM